MEIEKVVMLSELEGDGQLPEGIRSVEYKERNTDPFLSWGDGIYVVWNPNQSIQCFAHNLALFVQEKTGVEQGIIRVSGGVPHVVVYTTDRYDIGPFQRDEPWLHANLKTLYKVEVPLSGMNIEEAGNRGELPVLIHEELGCASKHPGLLRQYYEHFKQGLPSQ